MSAHESDTSGAANAGRAAGLALLAALAAACSRGRGTPESTFETIRAAAATRDLRLVYELHDRDAQGISRQKVREMRARLERGDPPEEALEGSGLVPDDVRTDDLAEAASRLMGRYSPLVSDGRWYANARVVASEPELEDTARVVVRGTDGVERTFWLVREDGRWAIDGMRTWVLADGSRK